MIQTEAIQFRTAEGTTYVLVSCDRYQHCDHLECCDDLELLKKHLNIGDIKSTRYIKENARRILLVEA